MAFMNMDRNYSLLHRQFTNGYSTAEKDTGPSNTYKFSQAPVRPQNPSCMCNFDRPTLLHVL